MKHKMQARCHDIGRDSILIQFGHLVFPDIGIGEIMVPLALGTFGCQSLLPKQSKITNSELSELLDPYCRFQGLVQNPLVGIKQARNKDCSDTNDTNTRDTNVKQVALVAWSLLGIPRQKLWPSHWLCIGFLLLALASLINFLKLGKVVLKLLLWSSRLY